MKKHIKYILLAVITFMSYMISLNAATISTSIAGTGNIDAGNTFSLTISATGENVWGLTMGLSYDANKLELTKSEAKSGFTATVGKNIVLDSTSGHNGTFQIIVLTFKAKSDFKAGQSTTVSLTNVKGSSDSEVMTGTGASKTIVVNVPKSSNNNLSNLLVDEVQVKNFNANTTTYNLGTVVAEKSSINISATAEDSKSSITGTGTKQLKYGSNTFKVVVKAENGKTKTYQITVNRTDPRNKDNTLSSLSVSPVNINFNKTTLNYNVIVEHNVEKVTISATPTDSKATVSGTGTKTLKDYVNTFKIVVKAENETTKTYTITLNRKDKDGLLGNVSRDNSLKSLVVTGYDLKFNKDTLSYNIEVDNSVSKVDVKAAANDSKSSIKITNVDRLQVGNNKITIDVTSEAGQTKTYVINVIRNNNIPTIKIEEFDKKIEEIENNKVIVRIENDTNTLSKENMSKIKLTEKLVTVNKYDENKKIIYSFDIDGNRLSAIQELNTEILFESSKKENIEQLSNYSDSIYMSFQSQSDFPNGVNVNINVSDKYKDGEFVNFYQYNEEENKLECIEKNIEVKDGYIKLSVKNPKESILTKSIIGASVTEPLKEEKDSNLFLIISIIELVLILILLVLLGKKNKNISTVEPVNNVQTAPVETKVDTAQEVATQQNVGNENDSKSV